MPTFIVKVPARLCPLLLDDFMAVHHVRSPAGLLVLLSPLQGFYEVVGAACADEARLNQGHGKQQGQWGEKRHRQMSMCEHVCGHTCAGSSSGALGALGLQHGSGKGLQEAEQGGHAHFEQSRSPFTVCCVLWGFHLTFHLNKGFRCFKRRRGGRKATAIKNTCTQSRALCSSQGAVTRICLDLQADKRRKFFRYRLVIPKVGAEASLQYKVLSFRI